MFTPVNKSLQSRMQKKVATDFLSELKSVENYPDLKKKMAHIFQQGLWEFIVENIGESKEANDLSQIYRSRSVA